MGFQEFYEWAFLCLVASVVNGHLVEGATKPVKVCGRIEMHIADSFGIITSRKVPLFSEKFYLHQFESSVCNITSESSNPTTNLDTDILVFQKDHWGKKENLESSKKRLAVQRFYADDSLEEKLRTFANTHANVVVTGTFSEYSNKIMNIEQISHSDLSQEVSIADPNTIGLDTTRSYRNSAQLTSSNQKTRKVLVALVNFAGYKSVECSKDDIKQILWSGSKLKGGKSVFGLMNNFLHGKVIFDAKEEVYGPISIHRTETVLFDFISHFTHISLVFINYFLQYI